MFVTETISARPSNSAHLFTNTSTRLYGHLLWLKLVSLSSYISRQRPVTKPNSNTKMTLKRKNHDVSLLPQYMNAPTQFIQGMKNFQGYNEWPLQRKLNWWTSKTGPNHETNIPKTNMPQPKNLRNHCSWFCAETSLCQDYAV